MTRFSLTRPLAVGALGLSVALLGCQPSTPTLTTGVVPSPAPGATPMAPLTQIAGLVGAADINGVPFAGADVKVFRPGQAEPVAVGKTGPDGRFSIALGNVIAPGGGNVIAPGGGNVIAPGGGNVIAPGGGNVIAPGGGNVIAPGGGNVIAPGGGNLMALGAPLKVVASRDGAALAGIATAGVIAAGGGNVIAAGGGNVIAPGGGNVIAPGGGNYRVRAAEAAELHMTPATTLAVIALGDRLDHALRAVESKDGQVLASALASVLSAYNKLADTVAGSLGTENGQKLVEAVTRALDANGAGALSPTVQTQLVGAIADFKTTFTESARALGDAIRQSGSSGDATGAGDGLSFGGVTAPAVGSGPTGSTGTTSHSGGGATTPSPVPMLVSVNGQLAPAGLFSGSPAPSPVPMRPTTKSFSAFNHAGSALGSPAFAFSQRYGVGLVSTNGKFYEIGGTNGSTPSAMVTEYALVTSTVLGTPVTELGARTEPQSLASAVYDHGTAVADNTVYVVGGRDGSGAKASVQTLPVAGLGSATPFVTSGQTLAAARFQLSLSVTATAAATRLYAVGGQGTGGTPLASVERKDVLPTSTGWSDAGAALQTARQAHASVVTTDGAGQPAFLYVLGGHAGTANLDSVERSAINADGSLAGFSRPNVTFHHPKTGATLTYPLALSDPTVNQTANPANNQSHGRFGMSVAVVGSWLYVFGGLVDDGAGNLHGVPWVDRAPIDPATGEVGAFTPSPAQFFHPRGFYALGLCFTNPGDPNTLTDALVFGGLQGTGLNYGDYYVERSVWR